MLTSGQWPVMMKMPFPMMISWRINVVRKPNFQRECTVLVLPESRSSSRWWQSRARASWGTSPTSFWLRSETGQLLPETAKKKFEFSGEKTNHKGEDFVFLCGSGIGNRLEREGGCGCRVPNSTGNKCGAVLNFLFTLCTISQQLSRICSPVALWSCQSDSICILSVQKIALWVCCVLPVLYIYLRFAHILFRTVPSLASSLCIAHYLLLVRYLCFESVL